MVLKLLRGRLSDLGAVPSASTGVVERMSEGPVMGGAINGTLDGKTT